MVVAAACDEHGSPVAFDQALQEARARIRTLEKALCEWRCSDCGYDLAIDQDEDEAVGECGSCAPARAALRGES
jgi:rubrerythrin